MGVQMRLITEAGIDQLSSMGFRKGLRIERRADPRPTGDGAELAIGAPVEIKVETLDEVPPAQELQEGERPEASGMETDPIADSRRMMARLRAETQRAEAAALQLASLPTQPPPLQSDDAAPSTNRDTAGVPLQILGDVASPPPQEAPAVETARAETKTITVPPELK